MLLDTGCSSTILDTDISEEIGLLLDLEHAITRTMYGLVVQKSVLNKK